MSNTTAANTTAATAATSTDTNTTTKSYIPGIPVVSLNGRSFRVHKGYGCRFGYYRTRKNVHWAEAPKNAIQTPEECAAMCLGIRGCSGFQYYHSPFCIDANTDACHCKYFWFESACNFGCNMVKKKESPSTYVLSTAYWSTFSWHFLSCRLDKLRGHISEKIVSTYLPEQVAVPIDCGLRGWNVSNSALRCGVSHEGRDNVIELSDGGSW